MTITDRLRGEEPSLYRIEQAINSAVDAMSREITDGTLDATTATEARHDVAALMHVATRWRERVQIARR